MNVYTIRLKVKFQEYSVLVSREIFMGNARKLKWRTKYWYFMISS
jgi:hypothetical protein